MTQNVCTDENLLAVVQLLRDRGREATPLEVLQWAQKMVMLYREWREEPTICDQWLEAVIAEKPGVTACLHVYFGDALPEAQ